MDLVDEADGTWSSRLVNLLLQDEDVGFKETLVQLVGLQEVSLAVCNL